MVFWGWCPGRPVPSAAERLYHDVWCRAYPRRARPAVAADYRVTIFGLLAASVCQIRACCAHNLQAPALRVSDHGSCLSHTSADYPEPNLAASIILPLNPRPCPGTPSAAMRILTPSFTPSPRSNRDWVNHICLPVLDQCTATMGHMQKPGAVRSPSTPIHPSTSRQPSIRSISRTSSSTLISRHLPVVACQIPPSPLKHTLPMILQKARMRVVDPLIRQSQPPITVHKRLHAPRNRVPPEQQAVVVVNRNQATVQVVNWARERR